MGQAVLHTRTEGTGRATESEGICRPSGRDQGAVPYRKWRMRPAETTGRKTGPMGLPEVGELDTTLVPGGVGPRPPQGSPGLGIEQSCVAAVGTSMAGLLGTVLECEGAGLQEGGPMGATRHHRAHQPLGSGQ